MRVCPFWRPTQNVGLIRHHTHKTCDIQPNGITNEIQLVPWYVQGVAMRLSQPPLSDQSDEIRMATGARPPYVNPPIDEALVALSLGSEHAVMKIAEGLKVDLATLLDGPLEPRGAQRNTSPGDEKEGCEQPEVVFVASGDQTRAVGVGTSLLSVHVRRPYPGWLALRQLVDEVIRAYRAQAVEGATVASVTIRYIDSILFERGEVTHWEDYLTTLPARPGSMPSRIAHHRSTTTYVDEDGDPARVARLEQHIHSSDDDGVVLVYDLEVVQVFSPSARLDGDTWLAAADELHHWQRQIFEDSITDRMRERFS